MMLGGGLYIYVAPLQTWGQYHGETRAALVRKMAFGGHATLLLEQSQNGVK